ncbi:MAG: hypothetical protein ABSC51_10820 [Gaiellaceae bacterium]
MEAQKLTPEERSILWEQFVKVHGESQAAYDALVSRLSAGGIAVTVSLATALKSLPGQGVTAVVLFLVSLGCGVASYLTAQRDMLRRLDEVRDENYPGTNCWGCATGFLNWTSGIALVVGGVLLALFIHSAT